MGKRKSQSFEPDIMSKHSNSKKNKKSKKEFIEEPASKSPKKSKSKDSSTIIVQAHDNGRSPKKSKKKHKKTPIDDIDNSVVHSPKKNKHKNKAPVLPVKVEKVEYNDSDDSEEDTENLDVISNACPIEDERDHDIDLTDIPRVDLEILLKSIQKVLPNNDTLMSKTRCKKLNWAKVAFGDYSADKCFSIWKAIQKCQRNYRIMSELIADAMVWLDAPWRNAMSAKATKNHPDFPKRPKSSFLLFLEDKRAEIIRENKDIKMTDISRIAGQKFKQLSEAGRAHYIERAASNMRLYDEQVKIFYNKHPELRIEPPQKYHGPKKPSTPFTLFLEDHLSKEKNVSDKNAYRIASKGAWDNMKMKKKLPWIRRALAEYKKYTDEVEVYNFEHPSEIIKPVKKILTKEESQYLDMSDGKPIKPPTSSYMLYTQNLMKSGELTSISAKDRVKAIAARWRDVDKKEKDRLDIQLQELHKKYKKEYKLYYDNLPEEERLKVVLQEEKKKKPIAAEKEKRKSVSKRDVSLSALPKNWSTMTEEDKEVYMSALNRVRNYFDTKLNESIQSLVPESDKREASDESEESDQESSEEDNINEESD